MTDVLVAGIGNIFFRDDGFGSAVARTLCAGGLPGSGREVLPDGVRVVDYGIRGVHLGYDLLDGVAALVLVDAVPDTVRDAGGDEPGTVVTLQIGPEQLGDGQFDAHGMSPVAVLAGLGALGAELPLTWLVGCVPADVSEGIGLSEPVTAAVEPAARAVLQLVADLAGRARVGSAG